MAKTIVGWEDLDKKLKALGDRKKQLKVARAAINFALIPVVEKARQEAPRGSEGHVTTRGNIVAPGFSGRSVKKRTVAGRAGDEFMVKGMVGVSKEAWYALLYDTGFTRTAKNGRRGQSVSGDHWLVRSLETQTNVVVTRFVQKMHRHIKKVAAK